MARMAPDFRFLTVADVAETLQISATVVRQLLNSGELLGIQVGGRGDWRIEADQLEAYIERQYARAARDRQSVSPERSAAAPRSTTTEE